jgi:hypothetical protein
MQAGTFAVNIRPSLPEFPLRTLNRENAFNGSAGLPGKKHS